MRYEKRRHWAYVTTGVTSGFELAAWNALAVDLFILVACAIVLIFFLERSRKVNRTAFVQLIFFSRYFIHRSQLLAGQNHALSFCRSISLRYYFHHPSNVLSRFFDNHPNVNFAPYSLVNYIHDLTIISAVRVTRIIPNILTSTA